jgi:hypothetical protein
MNEKIGLVLGIIFIVVFSGFFYFNHIFMNVSEDRFYSQDFDISKNKILIYGSSHLIQVNTTHIQNQIGIISEKYHIYNMAENADKPKKRSLNIEKDLKLNPEIVIYGIGFRDFNSITNEKSEFDFKLVDLIPFDTTELETLNPKLITLSVLRSIIIDMINGNSNVPYPNTAVFSQRIQEKIKGFEELQENSESFENILIPTQKNEQKEYFIDIIETLSKNKIKIIILITPHHSLAQEKIPESEKINFYKILTEIEDQFDVTVYNYSDRYENYSIWRDTSHIAYNEKSIMFSDDVAKIIIKEITK